MFEAAGVGVGGGPAGEFGDGERGVGDDQDRVAEAFAAQDRRVGDQGEVLEAGGGRGDLAAQMGERGPSARLAA